MDQITAAVPDGTGYQDVFDIVTADYSLSTSLCGRAIQLDTLAYETATSLGTRLPRVYTREGTIEAVEGR